MKPVKFEKFVNLFNRVCLILTLILVTPLLALVYAISIAYRLIAGEREPEL